MPSQRHARHPLKRQHNLQCDHGAGNIATAAAHIATTLLQFWKIFERGKGIVSQFHKVMAADFPRSLVAGINAGGGQG